MAAKTTLTAQPVKNAAIVDAAPEVNADDGAKTPAQIAAEAPGAIADPAPATTLDNPSGAIMEPAVVQGLDLSHEAIDANPRAGTSALQNAIDLNDAKRTNPTDPDFAGQGIDMTVYGNRTEQPATASSTDPAQDR